MKKNKYYAYLVPCIHQIGIKENWDECKKIVNGESNAKYKGFVNRRDAEEWLKAGANYNRKRIFRPGVYFDAGTGRGIGVEVSVTDENGHNLLSKMVSHRKLNNYGKLVLDSATNNYGELLACYYALKIALKENRKMIFGDSKLIINYWSNGFVGSGVTDPGTIALAKSVAKLRKEFELKGGKFEYVSGIVNSADLGFHR